MRTILMQADLKAPGEPFAHHFSACVGEGRACEGLRADENGCLSARLPMEPWTVILLQSL